MKRTVVLSKMVSVLALAFVSRLVLAATDPGLSINKHEPSSSPALPSALAAVLMDACGINDEVRRFAQQSQAGFESELDKAGAMQLVSEGRRFTADVNSEANISSIMVSRLRSSMTKSMATEEITFCRSALGRKVARLRQEYETGDEKFARFAQKYATDPAPESRISLAKRVDNAIAASRAMVDIQQSVVAAALNIGNRVLPESERKSQAEIGLILSGLHIQTEKVARNAAVAGYLAAFDELDDDEFRVLSEHLVGKSGATLNRVKFSSYLEHANNVARRAGEPLVAANSAP